MAKTLTPQPRRKYSRRKLGKYRPRGKAFKPGNAFGLATRFRKGVSGCPGGRAKNTAITHALRELLAVKITDENGQEFTAAELVAMRVVEHALNGSLPAASEVTDRTEGRPRQTIEMPGSRDDPLLQILEEMGEEHKLLGPPPKPREDQEPH